MCDRRARGFGRQRRVLLPLLFFLTLALSALLAGPGSALAAAVSGHVTDAITGDPIAWATVQSWYPNGDYAAQTYTDDNGDYTLALSSGDWKISFLASFHVNQFYNDKLDKASADPITVADTNLTGIDAALQRSPQAHVKGTVVDGGTGQPIGGVEVTACTVDGDNWTGGNDVTTAADGTYDLTVAPGTYGIVYDAYGYGRLYYPDASAPSGATLLTLNDGDIRTGTNMTFTRQPVTVTGWARDVDGTWLPGIELQVLAASDGHVIRSATTGADGTCVADLSDLLGQQVKFRLHDPSGEFADNYYDCLASGTPSIDQAAVVTPSLGGIYYCEPYLYNAREGEIKGRTLNAKGQPLGGIGVWLRSSSQPNYSVETVSDADGNYDVTGLRVSRASSFTIEFDPTDYFGTYLPEFYNGKFLPNDADSVPLAPGQCLTIDSQLYKRCQISGTVTDPGGPVKGIVVTLYDQDGQTVSTQTTPTNGSYSFTNLKPGDYRIGCHDTSVSDPNTLPVYRDQFSGGAATLDAATVIDLDGTDTATVVNDVKLVPWGGVEVQVDCSLEPYDYLGTMDVTLYDAGGSAIATSDGLNDEGGTFSYGYLFKRLDFGTYYLGASDPLGAYAGTFFDNNDTLAQATPIVLTESSSKSTPTIYLTPVRGVSPDFGVLPDGSPTVPFMHLGIKPAAIASSGETTLIGGAGPGSQHGTYVYERGDAGWAQRQLLSARGDAVAVDGDVAVATLAGGDAAHPGVGSASVYRRTAGVWTLEATLSPDDAGHAGGFGDSVALSGDTILVGAPYADAGTQANAGAVYVFVHSGDGWTQQARLTAGSGSGNAFGLHFALDGERALVSGVAGTTGSVTVFERSNATWQATAQLTASGLDPTATYGASLALSGDSALVGAPGQSDNSGAVYVFQNLTAGWTRTATLTAADGQPNDLFGTAIAYQDGAALIGAPDKGSVQTGWRNGAAYLFRQAAGAWCQDTEMQPAVGLSAIGYGNAVALAGRDLFVGAPGELRTNGTSGRVEIYSPYVTDAGVPLVVDASHGLLINDCGPEGEQMSVKSWTQPTHGTAQVGSDGSFTYTPDTDFVGTDQFNYQATSPSEWQSGSTTVTITVRDMTDPTLGTSGVPAGWVRSAPTVRLAAQDDTAVSAIEYRDDADAAWQMYDEGTNGVKVTSEGVSAYGVRARDVFGNSTASSFVVKLDTRRPTPKAPSAAAAKRGKSCALKYEVADPTPGSPTAKVKIVIRNSHGRQVWAKTLPSKPVNKVFTYTFRCGLARGSYRFSVYATDAAGNTQTKVASNRLTVK